MKNFRLTIGNRILFGFLALIAIFIINAVIIFITGNKNDNIIEETSSVVDPSKDAMQELSLLATRSKMLTTNWVYLQSNADDKQALEALHDLEYPDLRDRLLILKESWNSDDEKQMLDSVFINFESLLEVEKEIMASLKTFDDYEDPIIKFQAEDYIESDVLPQSTVILSQIEELSALKRNQKTEADNSLISSNDNLRNITITLGIIIVAVGLAIAFFMSRSITGPINYIKDIVITLSKGILPDDKDTKFRNDEIGEMAFAMDEFIVGLKSTSDFAESIGNGNYDAEFQPLSEDDVLGNSLLDMRENLKKVSDEDKKRSWATEGLAKFGDILRSNNDNIATLSDEIISNLVKYMKCNQGGLFIINDENDQEPYLELAACYAWDKKKYLEQKIHKGDGLTGQAWLEQDKIYLTEIPQDYINITSGLGEANPNSVVIIPLKVNEEVYGVIELASFNLFSDYEIEFIEKIAESIASTISSVKINERTQKLLEESTQLTEQMRSQEEEMRQNMEELQATQEEMERNQRETQGKENIINNTQMVFTLDSSMNIYSVNDPIFEKLGFSENDLLGKPIKQFVSSNDALDALSKVVQEGRTWTGMMSFSSQHGDPVSTKASAGRITDQATNEHKYLIFASDLS